VARIGWGVSGTRVPDHERERDAIYIHLGRLILPIRSNARGSVELIKYERLRARLSKIPDKTGKLRLFRQQHLIEVKVGHGVVCSESRLPCFERNAASEVP